MYVCFLVFGLDRPEYAGRWLKYAGKRFSALKAYLLSPFLYGHAHQSDKVSCVRACVRMCVIVGVYVNVVHLLCTCNNCSSMLACACAGCEFEV